MSAPDFRESLSEHDVCFSSTRRLFPSEFGGPIRPSANPVETGFRVRTECDAKRRFSPGFIFQNVLTKRGFPHSGTGHGPIAPAYRNGEILTYYKFYNFFNAQTPASDSIFDEYTSCVRIKMKNKPFVILAIQ